MTLRSQTLIAVADVARSRDWYTTILGCTALHGGDRYEQLAMGKAGAPATGQGAERRDDFFLQLHRWDADDHPNLVDRDRAPRGHGVLLWFCVQDFDAAVERARCLGAQVIEDVHRNPNAGHDELWLRDPDDYVVVLASRPGRA